MGRPVLVHPARRPSRSSIEQYQDYDARVRALAQRINDRFASAEYPAIILAIAHHEPATVYEYYRAANLCFVSSLHDGMNLVAKEFVASRDDERSVLVLSRFTGAARELPEALVVNPYDADQWRAGAAHRAHHAGCRAARSHAVDAGADPGVQCVPLGGPYAGGCVGPPAARATRRPAGGRGMTPLDPPAPRSEWAYFFDIDGTLSVLAPTPSSARLAPQVRERLEALRARCDGAVAVVSGRSLGDIDAICEGLELPAAGENGAERRTAAGRVVRLPVRRGQLDRALPVLRRLVERNPRLLLEDKGHSLALHYRAVPSMAGVAHRTMRQLQRSYGADFVVQSGKRVWSSSPLA